MPLYVIERAFAEQLDITLAALRHSEETDRVFPHAYRFAEGAMHPGDAPGLGVDIDRALHDEHPYAPAYLPVARRLDGTLHSW